MAIALVVLLCAGWGASSTTESLTHLHRPSDTVETLEPDLFEAAARLTFMTAAAVADGRYDRDERLPPAQ